MRQCAGKLWADDFTSGEQFRNACCSFHFRKPSECHLASKCIINLEYSSTLKQKRKKNLWTSIGRPRQNGRMYLPHFPHPDLQRLISVSMKSFVSLSDFQDVLRNIGYGETYGKKRIGTVGEREKWMSRGRINGRENLWR